MTATPKTPRRKVGRDKLRNVRVDDDLWEDAADAVMVRGDPSLSHVIRQALLDYVRETRRMEARGHLPSPEQRSEPT
jgi:hypothetical protein